MRREMGKTGGSRITSTVRCRVVQCAVQPVAGSEEIKDLRPERPASNLCIKKKAARHAAGMMDWNGGNGHQLHIQAGGRRGGHAVQQQKGQGEPAQAA